MRGMRTKRALAFVMALLLSFSTFASDLTSTVAIADDQIIESMTEDSSVVDETGETGEEQIESSEALSLPDDIIIEEDAEETDDEAIVSEEAGDEEVAIEETEAEAEEVEAEVEEAEEVVEEAVEAEEAISYPSFVSVKSTAYGTVTITAPEGAFPEGTSVEITDATADVADSFEGEDYFALDISFFNAEGEEIEPLCDINVAIDAPFDEADEVEIYHMADAEAEAEFVETAVVEDGTVEFYNSDFSIWIITKSDIYIGEYIYVNLYRPYSYITKLEDKLDAPIGPPFNRISFSDCNAKIDITKDNSWNDGKEHDILLDGVVLTGYEDYSVNSIYFYNLYDELSKDYYGHGRYDYNYVCRKVQKLTYQYNKATKYSSDSITIYAYVTKGNQTERRTISNDGRNHLYWIVDENVSEYTITYKDGFSGTTNADYVDPQKVTAGEYSLLDLPSAWAAHPGYKFLGWYTEEGKKASAKETISKDTVYTAKWEQLSLEATVEGVSQVYTGEEFSISVRNVKDSDGNLIEGCSVNVFDGYNNKVNNNFKNVTDGGTYSVVISKDGYKECKVENVSVTIAKANVSVTAPTAAEDLVYNNGAQNLVNAGLAVPGTVVYGLSENDLKEDIPTATNAGKYTVYYSVILEDDAAENYNAVEVKSVETEIAKADVSVTAPTAVEKLIYNKNAQYLVNAGSAVPGTVVYGLSENDLKKDIPTEINAGKYTVYYSVDLGNDAANYNEVVVQSVEAEIAKASATITLTRQDPNFLQKLIYKNGIAKYDIAFDGEEKLKVSVSDDDAIVATIEGNVLTLEPKKKAADHITVTVSAAESGNYNAAEAKIEELSVENGNIEGFTVAGYRGTYDGKAHEAVIVSTPASVDDKEADVKIEYAISGNEEPVYSETNPTFMDAGNYTVLYRVTCDGYKPITGSVDVVISKRPAQISWKLVQGQNEFSDVDAGKAGTQVIFNGNMYTVIGTVDNAAEGDDLFVNRDPYEGKVVKSVKTKAIKITFASDKSTLAENYTLEGATGTEFDWEILPKDLSNKATIEASETYYQGINLTTEVVVKDGDKVLTEDADYSVEFSNNRNATMEAVAKVTFKGNYVGSQTQNFQIHRFDLDKNTTEDLYVEVKDISDLTYNTKEQRPAVKVVFHYVDENGEPAEETIDSRMYNVSYKNNKNAGKATVTVKFNNNSNGVQSNFKGEISKDFTINKAKGKLSLVKDKYSFDLWGRLVYGDNIGIYFVTEDTNKQTMTFTYGDNKAGSSDIVSASVDRNGYIKLEPGKVDGTVTVYINEEESANYLASETSITVTVVNGKLYATASDVHVTYDGEEHGLTVKASKFGRNPKAEDEISIEYAPAHLEKEGNGWYSQQKLVVDGDYVESLKYTNAGEYVVAYKVECDGYVTETGYNKVIIDKKDVNVVWDKSNTFTYDAKEKTYEPKMTGIVAGDESSVKLIISEDSVTKATNAGEYKVNIEDIEGEKANNYNLVQYVQNGWNWNGPTYENTWEHNWKINKKALKSVSFSANKQFTYDGQWHEVVATFDESNGVCSGDKVNPVYSEDSVTKAIDACMAHDTDWYYVTVTGVDNDNYKLELEKSWWNWTPETTQWQIHRKKVSANWYGADTYWGFPGHNSVSRQGFNFYYSELPYTMTAAVNGAVKRVDSWWFDDLRVVEYADNSHTSVGNYTAKAVKLSNANYKLDDSKEAKWSISYKAMPDAYLLPSEAKDGWVNSDITLGADWYQIKDIDDKNGQYWPRLLRSDETYGTTINYCLKDAEGYVSAPKSASYKIDKTAPNGNIRVDFNSITTKVLKWFFKDSVTVKVDSWDAYASFVNSGVKSVEYVVLDAGTALDRQPKWEKYENSIILNASQTSQIYVKITDNAGNYTIINSDNVIVYQNAGQNTEEVNYVRLTKEDQSVLVNLNSNTIKDVRNGEYVLKKGKDYTISGNDEIVLSGEYLETLAARETVSNNDANTPKAKTYTFNVSYNANGETYDPYWSWFWFQGGDSVGENIEDTTFVVNVYKAEDAVTVNALDKTYDGVAVAATFSTESGRNAVSDNDEFVVEYRANVADQAEDAGWTKTAPANAGSYQVKVTALEDDNYYEASKIIDFTIARRSVEVEANDASKVEGSADPTLTYSTSNDVAERVRGNIWRFAGEAPGEYDIVVSIDHSAYPNYDISTSNGTFTITALPVVAVAPPTAPTFTAVAPTEVAEAEEVEAPVEEVVEEMEVPEEETPLAEGPAEVEIEEEAVPEAAATCIMHWVILGVAALYAVYALLRAVQNKKELDGEEKTAEN